MAGVGLMAFLGYKIFVGVTGKAAAAAAAAASSAGSAPFSTSASSSAAAHVANSPDSIPGAADDDRYEYVGEDGVYWRDEEGTDWFQSRETQQYFWFSHDHEQWVACVDE